jgi:cytochrome b subunit of formate dehydrogenase
MAAAVPDTREAEFVRMTLQERLQHGVLIVSFLMLVATGLPLVIYEWNLVELVFLSRFSFALRGALHRAGAVLLIVLALWHAGYLALTARGRETARAMMFGAKDFRDAFEILVHNLGITAALERRGIGANFFRRHPYWLFAEAPRCGRYSFIEKFEYLAVVWGSLVMIGTGLLMWRVDLAMRLFPRYVFDVFVTIHSYEAILAFLAILVWHMYNVHLAPGVFPMSRVWLTGRISRAVLERDHPLEYEAIERARRGESTGQ